ncbi:MAG TPA: large-conductance mechanosensitive channel protein MscL [Bacteroidota bacterium]|jgi:large conductance mechanosensitive channel|nr:large-conductance mechanosensitive channel protein MscL [Bacteroidota bacterium]
MLNEFKKFIMRGNALDLAIGVIIGAAFGKIVNSIIADILMPPIGLLISNVDFKDIKINIGITNPVYLNIGNFIQTAFEFLIIAFVLFLVIKAMNRFFKKQEEEIKPAEPSQVQLLTEIRDLLKK